MKTIGLIFLISLSMTVFGQSVNSDTLRLKEIGTSETCEINQELAKLDIKQGHPRLLLIGGIAPAIFVGQEDFEKRFNIKYYDFGCTPPDRECVKDYNKVVFNYLDDTYGTKWRKKVRKDVIGYSDRK